MINFIINSGYSFFSLRKSLAVSLLSNKHDLKIITPNNSKRIKKDLNSKLLKVQTFKFHDDKNSLISLLKNAVNLFIFLRKKKNINIIFGSYLNLVFGIISFFIPSKKNIFVFTGLGSFFNNEKKFLIKFVKLFFNLVLLKKNSIFIFYNKFDRNFLINKNLHHKSKIILGSGININNNFYKKKKTKKINFIFFSRFNLDKGLIDLIKAISIVNAKGFEKNCNFYFYGLFDKNPTSINKKYLKKLISENKNSFLKETTYNVDLEKIFSKSHVLILPSHNEGLPKTVLEAMNFNCALLLSNIPGHKFLINKKHVNGLYFKKKNEIDLSNKIIWMIKNKKKLTYFFNNSKKNLENFSSDRINKKFYETIKQV